MRGRALKGKEGEQFAGGRQLAFSCVGAGVLFWVNSS